MNTITLQANAKINLTLDVLEKRNDGYHEVRMVMQSISLCDDVTIEKNSGGLSLSCNLPYLPTDERNLAFRAARRFYATCGLSPAVSISLCKRIPVGAGLAGGSTDCAAVLSGLNRMYDTPLSKDALLAIGTALGADVPFCMQGGTMLAEGIGERLTPLPAMPDCGIVLVKPRFSVSTPWVYGELDRCEIKKRPDTGAIRKALEQGVLSAIAPFLLNVMETVTAREHPVINDIILSLKSHGAINAVMSGSGPTVFGLFESLHQAKLAADALAPSPHEIFVAQPV